MHAHRHVGARGDRARPSRRPSYASVTSTLALVLAIGGGTAFAAHLHYLIFSIRQIKPAVVRELRGQRGPRGPRGFTGAGGAKGATGATGATGAAGAAAGFFAQSTTATAFTGGSNTQILAKSLPTGDFVLAGAATITATSTMPTTTFKVTCTVSDTGTSAVDTVEFAGVTNAAGDTKVFALPLDLAINTTAASTAKLTCSDAANGGNSYAVSATTAALTAIETAQNS